MKNKNLLLSFLLSFTVIALFQTSCTNTGEGEETDKDSTVQEEVHEEHGHKAEWSYEGETGPEHWAEVVEGCSCGGRSQSPIDIVGAEKDDALKALQLNYLPHNELDIINNGHTVQVNYPVGDFTIEDVKFDLAQFHFHAGSEHFIDGKQYALEAHLVHLTEDGNIAVIGIMIEEGEENPFFAKFWDKIPTSADENLKEALEFDVNEILPEDKSYYHYMGSLTTPPCTEGVKWYVLKTPIKAGAEQIEKLSNAMPKNNFRPVQALNERKITEF